MEMAIMAGRERAEGGEPGVREPVVGGGGEGVWVGVAGGGRELGEV